MDQNRIYWFYNKRTFDQTQSLSWRYFDLNNNENPSVKNIFDGLMVEMFFDLTSSSSPNVQIEKAI